MKNKENYSIAINAKKGSSVYLNKSGSYNTHYSILRCEITHKYTEQVNTKFVTQLQLENLTGLIKSLTRVRRELEVIISGIEQANLF